MEDSLIKKILIEEGYISQDDMNDATTYADKNGGSVVDFLFKNEILTKEIFGQALAEYYNVKFVDLQKVKIDDTVLQHVPEVIARSKEVIAFAEEDSVVKIGMTNPDDLEVRNNIAKKFGKDVSVYYLLEADLERAFEYYKESLKIKFDEFLSRLKDKSITRDESDELVVTMVDNLLEYAEQNKASDIHIEPYLKKIEVRFRIDGVMHNVLELPKDLHEVLLSRIKIMARMRTDEHRAAQDGKLRFTSGKSITDVRVSIVPVVEGENIVMRILSSKSREFDLTSLGFVKENFKTIRRAIKSPHGMILVTGPTGSGKTTTLYAILKMLNNPKVHISTIEDPVEYDIEGISQIQVNPKTDLTFAKGLRAIVRQDPDIIMVGEIRDKETASIAINSALTGHLVLSTLHTNDAATTLPRLIDMAVEPYLVASTINIVVAQRLVRKICQSCRASIKLDRKQIKSLTYQNHIKKYLEDVKGKDVSKINFYHGVGCKVCNNTGYVGRIGIFEVLQMTDRIKELITKRATSGVINKQAKEEGMKTMLEDGLEKVLAGETTLDEVIRVTK